MDVRPVFVTKKIESDGAFFPSVAVSFFTLRSMVGGIDINFLSSTDKLMAMNPIMPRGFWEIYKGMRRMVLQNFFVIDLLKAVICKRFCLY